MSTVVEVNTSANPAYVTIPSSGSVASNQESLITTTASTPVTTYTPSADGLFNINVYLRVITASTTVGVTVTYTDAGGAQTVTMLPSQSLAPGSYTVQSVFISASSGGVISVNVTAGTANQVYASVSIGQA